MHFLCLFFNKFKYKKIIY